MNQVVASPAWERKTYYMEWEDDDGTPRVLESDDFMVVAFEIARQEKLHHHYSVRKGGVPLFED